MAVNGGSLLRKFLHEFRRTLNQAPSRMPSFAIECILRLFNFTSAANIGSAI